MRSETTNPAKAKSAPRPREALSTSNFANVNPHKVISTIRARLCMAGGQTLHVGEGGVFFVTTPFMHVTRFGDLQALEAYLAKVGA